jgi:hypothetical protein
MGWWSILFGSWEDNYHFENTASPSTEYGTRSAESWRVYRKVSDGMGLIEPHWNHGGFSSLEEAKRFAKEDYDKRR